MQGSTDKKKSLMMTLERLISFIDIVIHRDTWHVSRDQSSPDDAPQMWTSHIKRTTSLQAPPDVWQRASNANLTY